MAHSSPVRGKSLFKHTEDEIKMKRDSVNQEVDMEVGNMGINLESMKKSLVDPVFAKNLELKIQQDLKERKEELDDVSFYEQMRNNVENVVSDNIPAEISPVKQKREPPTQAQGPIKTHVPKKRVSIQNKEVHQQKNVKSPPKTMPPSKINIPNSNMAPTPLYQNLDPYSQYAANSATFHKNMSPTKKLSQMWNGVADAISNKLMPRKPSGNERFLRSMSKEMISSPTLMTAQPKMNLMELPKNIKKTEELSQSDGYDSDDSSSYESNSEEADSYESQDSVQISKPIVTKTTAAPIFKTMKPLVSADERTNTSAKSDPLKVIVEM